MKLVTKEIIDKFEKNKLYSKEEQGLDAKVIVKFFNPYGAGTWLITEAEKMDDGDYRLYGYMHLYCCEWGYVLLSEIESVRVKIGGCSLPLERDLYAKGTVRELCR